MKKILVVDNNSLMVKFLSDLLTKEGHQVLTALDGLSALDILRTYIPEVVFVDLIMPNIDGKKLCQIIRTMPELRDAYVVVLSAVAAEDVIDLEDLGAHAYIAKGRFDEVARHINELLNQLEKKGLDEGTGKIIGLGSLHSREITQELLSTRRHFESILESMSEGIIEVTSGERIVYANPAALAMIEIPEERLLGTKFTELFSESDQEKIAEILRNTRSDPPINSEGVPLNRHGKEITMSTIPVKDDGNKPLIILRDISEWKNMVESLKESEFKYRTLFESSPDAIMMFDKESFFDCNSATLSMYGFSAKEEFARHHPGELSPSTQPDGRDSFTAANEHIEKAFRDGTDFFVWWHKRVDGSIFPSEVLLNKLELGGREAVQALVRDISERKRAEDLLESKSEEQALLLDNIQTQIWYLKDPETYGTANKAHTEFIGKEKEAIENKSLYDFLPKETADVCVRVNREVFDRKEPLQNEELAPDYRGEGRMLLVTKTPKLDSDGNVEFVVCSAEDITDRKRIETSLKESEARYRGIFDSAQDGILIFDQKGTIVEANPQACIMYGYSHEELVGLSGKEIVHPDHHFVFERFRNNVKSTGKFQSESIDIRKDGTRFNVDVTGTEFDYRGKKHLLAVVRDITERKHAEEALANSERRLADIIQGSPIPIFVLDNKHVVKYWNKACESLTGIGAGEVIGTKNQWMAFYSAERRTLADFIVDNAPEEEIARYYGGRYRKFISIDGAYEAEDFFPALGKRGKWLFFSAAPLRDVKGRLTGAIEVLQDMTERKIAEEKLRESEERFRSLFEQSNDAILIHTLNSQILDVNARACEMLRYDRQELCSLTISALLPESEHATTEKAFQDTQEKGYTRFETRFQRADKTLVDVEISSRFTDLEKGIVQGICRDISERKRSEEELKKAKEITDQAKAALEKTNQQLEKANKELQRLTFIDGLTGIANRRHFDQMIENEWRRALRNQESMAFIMIDIDYFKHYNDYYGHQDGDECLKKVAKALSRMAKRPGDLAARYGGEEFAVILSNTGATSAVKLAEEARTNILDLKMAHNTSEIGDYVTISVGVATVIPNNALSPQDLIEAADKSLYGAKRGGRNQVGVIEQLNLPTE
ncbi:MAG: PAS domain S-box protein [Deltaproteobacteria bacterium]|nr:PAS domain S-box protein [Deltaproteobacteria bacterium]